MPPDFYVKLIHKIGGQSLFSVGNLHHLGLVLREGALSPGWWRSSHVRLREEQ
jgi:hypothetical protein